jgi:hypothetical protein
MLSFQVAFAVHSNFMASIAANAWMNLAFAATNTSFFQIIAFCAT